MTLTLVAVLAVIVLAFAAYVRLAPVDPARWHVDPLTGVSPGAKGWLVRPDGGNGAWPVFARTPDAGLVALNDTALATPRTRAIAGSVSEGRITYITRSRLWGFPDFTTVQVVPTEAGTTFAILARLRFGQSDTGVNRARVEAWESALRQRLAG